MADNGQLFLTGYSQGGYVTLAAHRALQAGNSPHLQQLRMVVPGAGPYDVQTTMDGLVNLVRQEQPVIGALINPGFLRYLGGSVQREVRRVLLRALIPGDADVAYDTRFIDLFLADDVRAAVLERRGPYAELLAVAEACASLDPPRMEEAARQVGLDAETLNRALLAATAWAAEVTVHWE